MTSGPSMHRKPWQPTRPLTQAEQDYFWARVVKKEPGGHWIWSVSFLAMDIDGQWVSANRIAWALRYPGMAIPERIYKNKKVCAIGPCINPEHANHAGGPELTPVKVEITTFDPDSFERTVNGNGHAKEDGQDILEINGPNRILEAMAALQFGTPVRPRPLRALVKPAELETPEGVVMVDPPAAMETFTPNEQEIAAAPEFTLEELVATIFQPDTVVMTFKTGSVWIMGPRGRVAGNGPAEALLGYMIQTGRHKVKR